MTSAGLITAYNRDLGFASDEGRERRMVAFQIAHDLRKFEIELIWKRSAYFWGLQIAAFTGSGLLGAALGTTLETYAGAGARAVILPLLFALVALFGLAGALCWYGTARASKVWMYNYERHIDFLEGEFAGNLYKTLFFRHSGRTFSDIGINEAMTFVSVFIWLTILVVSAIPIVVVFGHGPGAIAAVATAYVLVVLGFVYLATHVATSPRMVDMTPLGDIAVLDGRFWQRPLAGIPLRNGRPAPVPSTRGPEDTPLPKGSECPPT